MSDPQRSEPGRELTVDELDVDDMVANMHVRMGRTWALVTGTAGAEARQLGERLWELLPFLKALGRLALEQPERARQLWADALREPMPFGGDPLGMPRTKRPTP